jgi:cyanate permease
LFALAVPLAFGAGWGWPGLFNLAVVSHNSAAPGAATGVTQTGTHLGAMLGPVLFGWIVKAVSWEAAWAMVVVWLLLAAVTTHLARASLRRAIASA